MMARASYTDEQALDALRAYAAEHGRTPTHDAWRLARARPSTTCIISKFGSWSAAIERAGLPQNVGVARALDDETAQIVARLERQDVTISELARELGLSVSALCRRVDRYNRRHGRPERERHGMSAAEREEWQLTRDPKRRDL